MSVSIGEAVTVLHSTTTWRTSRGRKYLFRAFVIARAWPGSRFNWFEYTLQDNAEKRFRIYMRDENVTWVRGHGSPAAREWATTLALEDMADADEGVERLR